MPTIVIMADFTTFAIKKEIKVEISEVHGVDYDGDVQDAIMVGSSCIVNSKDSN